MTDNRKIVGAVVQNGRTYTAGAEDALAKVLPPSDIARLVKAGQLSGDWGTGMEAASKVAEAEVEPEAELAEEPVEEIDSEHMEGLPVLADLPAHLATLTTVEEIKALRKTDKRKGAKPLYVARLAELK